MLKRPTLKRGAEFKYVKIITYYIVNMYFNILKMYNILQERER